jgi:hypothetical protein
MGEAEMHRIILAGALASLTFFEIVGSEGHTSRIEGNVPQRALKGDRLDVGRACSPSARPHDGTSCVRKQTPAADHPPRARELRVALADGSLMAPDAFIGRCDCSH